MKTVTYTPKRYIHTCANCGLLFDAGRADQLTCSPTCRVTGHRNGEIKALRAMAKSHGVEPREILEASAVILLCSDLEAAIMAGTLTFDAVRNTVRKRFDERVAALGTEAPLP